MSLGVINQIFFLSHTCMTGRLQLAVVEKTKQLCLVMVKLMFPEKMYKAHNEINGVVQTLFRSLGIIFSHSLALLACQQHFHISVTCMWLFGLFVGWLLLWWVFLFLCLGFFPQKHCCTTGKHSFQLWKYFFVCGILNL